MKIGFRTAGFSAWELGPTLRAIRDAGYDSVELCLEHPGSRPEMMDDVRITRVLKMLEEIELELSSVSYHGDGSPAAEREAKALLAIEVTRKMGAKVLVMNSDGKDPANPNQLAEFEQRLRRFCKAAERHKIDLALEPEPNLLIDSSADLEALAARVCSPRLKMNIDVGHAFITDPDVVQTIRRMGNMIVHTHVEDIAGKVHKHLLAGEGDIDLRAVFAALRDVGFAGSLTIDLFNLGDKPDEMAKAAYHALKRIMNE